MALALQRCLAVVAVLLATAVDAQTANDAPTTSAPSEQLPVDLEALALRLAVLDAEREQLVRTLTEEQRLRVEALVADLRSGSSDPTTPVGELAPPVRSEPTEAVVEVRESNSSQPLKAAAAAESDETNTPTEADSAASVSSGSPAESSEPVSSATADATLDAAEDVAEDVAEDGAAHGAEVADNSVVDPPTATTVESTTPVAVRTVCPAWQVFDSNEDGSLSGADRYWRHFALWIDDGDDRVDATEMEDTFRLGMRALDLDLRSFKGAKDSSGWVDRGLHAGRELVEVELLRRGQRARGATSGFLALDVGALVRGGGPSIRQSGADVREGFVLVDSSLEIQSAEGWLPLLCARSGR